MRPIKLSAAATAIVAFASTANAQYISAEGGLACSRNKAMITVTNGVDTIKLGDDGCSATGSAEIGRTGTPVVGVFDHWAVRGRFTALVDKETAGALRGTQFDRRYVFDAELGTKINFLNFFGGTQRITVGARVAHWQATASDVVPPAFEVRSFGFGPRIGLRSSTPIGTHFLYESQLGASALFGRASGDLSGSAVTYSIDSSSALGYKIDGTETGRIFSVGLFSEYWFNKFDGVNGSVNRHSWGPFARVRMPLP